MSAFFLGFASEFMKIAQSNPLGVRNPNFNPLNPRGSGSARAKQQAATTPASPSPSPVAKPSAIGNPGLRAQAGFANRLQGARQRMLGSSQPKPAPKPTQSVQQAAGGAPPRTPAPAPAQAAPKPAEPKINMGAPSVQMPKGGPSWKSMSGSQRGSAINKLF